jgi:hypothetical protein
MYNINDNAFSKAEYCQDCGNNEGPLRELGREFVVGGRVSSRKTSWAKTICDKCWADYCRLTISIDLD